MVTEVAGTGSNVPLGAALLNITVQVAAAPELKLSRLGMAPWARGGDHGGVPPGEATCC